MTGQRVFMAVAVAAMLIAIPAIAQGQERPDDEGGTPQQPAGAPSGPDEGGVGTESHGVTGDFDDFVSIRNVSGTGQSRLNLNTTDSVVVNQDTWRVANDADTGLFQILEGATTPRMVIEQGGNVGLGTTDPLSPLHIDRSGGFQLRLVGSGADYRFDAFGTSLRMGPSSNTNAFRIFEDATFNNLTVSDGNVGIGTGSPEAALDVRDGTTEVMSADVNGVGIGTASPGAALDVRDGATQVMFADVNGLGVGTASPAADLHVSNVAGTPATNIRFQNAGQTWANAVTSGGVFRFNKIGTGQPEALFREFGHSRATLEVNGPIGASEFKTFPLPGSSEAQAVRASGEDPSEGVDLLERIIELEARVAELEAKLDD
jgi:hypothetical protein